VRGEQNDRNSKPHAVARLRIMAQRAEPVQQCLRDLGEHAGMRIARQREHNDIDPAAASRPGWHETAER
jgi:hypothetical protein